MDDLCWRYAIARFSTPGCGSSVPWGMWQPYGSGRMP